MENYKIKVTTEAESKEAQELLEQLELIKDDFDDYGFPYYVASNNDGTFTNYILGSDTSGWKELTPPQLRDLVVLHRNNVSDANYIGKHCGDFYVTSDGIIYGFNDDAWEIDDVNTMDFIKPINKELISGADALRALADGEDVEYFSNADYTWKSIFKYHPSLEIIANKELDINHKFRLKPRTITLNIEIPKPFEPTKDEEFYVLSSVQSSGYIKTHLKKHAFLGAWKSEHDIQQVVAALRKGFKL